MKFTLSWLKDYLETTASVDEVVEKLTMVGLRSKRLSIPARALRAL
jgi:phenylalanyl-tRNA synthetase beta chain